MVVKRALTAIQIRIYIILINVSHHSNNTTIKYIRLAAFGTFSFFGLQDPCSHIPVHVS